MSIWPFNRKTPPRPPVANPVTPQEGYLENDKGHLVPVAQIPPRKLEENKTVLAIADKLNALAETVVDTKTSVLEELKTRNGPDGEKTPDYETLYSFDGRWKVVISTYKHRVFNEHLRSAYRLMMDCIERWSEQAQSKGGHMLQALAIQRVDFERMTANEKNKIWELQKIEAPEDPDWDRALGLLGRSVEVVRTKKRVNLYRRDEETRQYELVQVNFYRA